MILRPGTTSSHLNIFAMVTPSLVGRGIQNRPNGRLPKGNLGAVVQVPRYQADTETAGPEGGVLLPGKSDCPDCPQSRSAH